jgi:hypothetical protein
MVAVPAATRGASRRVLIVFARSVASRGSGAMNARDRPLLGPGSSHDSARRTAQYGLLCSAQGRKKTPSLCPLSFSCTTSWSRSPKSKMTDTQSRLSTSMPSRNSRSMSGPPGWAA